MEKTFIFFNLLITFCIYSNRTSAQITRLRDTPAFVYFKPVSINNSSYSPTNKNPEINNLNNASDAINSSTLGRKDADIFAQTNKKAASAMNYNSPVIPPSDPQALHQFLLNNAATENRQQQSMKEYQAIMQEEKIVKEYIDYFQTSQFLEQTKYYKKALEEITGMLERKLPLSLKRATFLIENAYYDGKLNYSDYCKEIDGLLAFCKAELLQLGYREDDKLAKNLILYRLYTDTLKMKDPIKGWIKHYPIKYDFNDFWGEKDWAKMFVVKVLYSNSGNCHSLPLLYMILAEEFGAEAFLSFSPNHSYIKFKDKTGTLYNFETTNGHLVTDSWIMSPQYIKSEAVQSGLYMDTVSIKETVALSLTDLASGFERKFGVANGDFLLKCSDISLKHFPNRNYSASVTKSNTYLSLFILSMRYFEAKDPEAFIAHNPEGKRLWAEHNKYYMEIRDKGYEEIPKHIYQSWLNSVESEKQKQEHKNILTTIKKRVNN